MQWMKRVTLIPLLMAVCKCDVVINVTLVNSGLIEVQPIICPVGYYCPQDCTQPIPCPGGTFRNVTGAGRVEDCVTCMPGFYCPERSVLPLVCPPGTYMPYGGGSLCDPCPADFYCPSSLVQILCPVQTFSYPGSTGSDQCRCKVGFVCTYVRQVHVIISLNVTAHDFNDNVGNVRTNLVSALAAASGVPETQVILEA